MDLCMLPHGKCGQQTHVQQLRVQIPRWSARGLGREEKGQAAPPRSSCGAKPPESEASSAAAQPKKRPVSQRQNFAEAVVQERRRVQATLPMESRSQADSEATDTKIDEDSSQDREASLLEEKKQERDELQMQLQNYKPLHQSLHLVTEVRERERSGSRLPDDCFCRT